MNNKILAILGTTIISIATIGGVTFASTVNDTSTQDNQQIEENVDANKRGYNNRSCHNSSRNGSKDMVKIMKDNGFEDVAKRIQSGDHDEVKDYMKNISKEDYNKMINIMNKNGYTHMGKMMKTLGRKGMIQMHKTMRFMHSSDASNMMENFQ